MGLIHGFVAGTTVTLSALYLTHRSITQNTIEQRTILSNLSHTLATIPLPPSDIKVRPMPFVKRVSLVETMKDMWDSELERIVRTVQKVDWRGVREGVEDGIGEVVRRVKGGNAGQ
ncbi:hypothetical protein BJ508DRAFT_414115 [Ascobolus immersus RN42]|uniref:MICOS complex subunit MIC12 n=1 Tax=Ascobolus immersus RN42 TaxID=1160509 RepID=A0A3N4IAK1_ASCIM|nr:hypothetical protein BJ508DRAFT_414115 [Ascobolus immersus RN42]